jgi:predicted nucleic acid-binding protein
MKRLFIDTDIIIDYTYSANDTLRTLLLMQESGNTELYVNLISITEFFTDKNIEKLKVSKQADSLFHNFTIMNLNQEEAYIAAELMREKYITSIGDAYIAATCIKYGIELVTRNIKHFKNIPGLRIYSGYNID